MIAALHMGHPLGVGRVPQHGLADAGLKGFSRRPAQSDQQQLPNNRPMPPQPQRQRRQHSRPNERLREDEENFEEIKQDLSQEKIRLYLRSN